MHTSCIDKINQLNVMMNPTIVHNEDTVAARVQVHIRELGWEGSHQWYRSKIIDPPPVP